MFVNDRLADSFIPGDGAELWRPLMCRDGMRSSSEQCRGVVRASAFCLHGFNNSGYFIYKELFNMRSSVSDLFD